MPIRPNDIESELSYAYLHAVASHAGISCTSSGRNDDNYAIDAVLNFYDKIPDTYITDVSARVQLKATIANPTEVGDFYSYQFNGINQYNLLRTYTGGAHRILVVLFLPGNLTEWLKCSPTELVLKNAAYWVCLYGAEASRNDTSQVVYLPKANLLTPESVIKLFHTIGKNELPNYIKP